MKNVWLNILKPKGSLAKWLLFLMIAVILVLGAFGHFDVIKQYTDTEALSFKMGSYKISAYEALKAGLIIILIFWTAAIVSDIAENRIGKFRRLRAANRALLLKIIQIIIYFISFLFALDILGIDLTALAVFSGALGIGLGFGLQKIASNFISGIILLLEKSVEQDDLVEMADGTFGFVRRANARFLLLETFDGKEIMIPNEDFITSRVINWTYSNSKGRVEIMLSVSYGSDIEKARELILEAAKAHPRCIAEPEPKCYLRNFGDSSVDFILHFWVADVTTGRWEPQSEVMFDIWNKFKENGIEIPFPQRDLHIKNPDMLKVKIQGK
ncbi:MAG: mechanosensitive ion channel [Rhodospirillales bacterium]|nr:mechanosensitive ion channel [Alphaproteobacteria bacterium]USO03063.1 MAG: mechanosensitive ion channel [Rhodospirillales bacterium]